MSRSGRSVAAKAFGALPAGALGGLTAMYVWEVLQLPGVVAAAAAAATAMALAALHAMLEPLLRGTDPAES